MAGIVWQYRQIPPNRAAVEGLVNQGIQWLNNNGYNNGAEVIGATIRWPDHNTTRALGDAYDYYQESQRLLRGHQGRYLLTINHITVFFHLRDGRRIPGHINLDNAGTALAADCPVVVWFYRCNPNVISNLIKLDPMFPRSMDAGKSKYGTGAQVEKQDMTTRYVVHIS
ncbi:hypothetical protein P170DRAFT_460787 [Aspergillus steynii IBT 23096]|uniref:Uncharacterized protein n=1 Tax=Aspergillus steynii IBT 23096 TaxID=1392250 RepID=A0A2I2GPD8_9EURO|nr:uncharacterized protein P170DRAFT_460787 [Aspergillus steynii IBT 23096]PLB54739.1 hypothetical protein P170DRAFT_460787 [Aspergillus steynii IBT 23096]